MGSKPNIRSIRFSDELAELIDRQIGSTFTEKFENLITRCVWELPEKEKQLELLEEEIKRKTQRLKETELRYTLMLRQLRELEPKMIQLELAVSKALEDWQKNVTQPGPPTRSDQ